MTEESPFLAPGEMQPRDWEHFDKTGLPPCRRDSAAGVAEQLAKSGWPVDEPADPIEEAKAEAERERLEAMSPADHLKDIQEGRWQPKTR